MLAAIAESKSFLTSRVALILRATMVGDRLAPPKLAEVMKRRDRRGPQRKNKTDNTQGLCDPTIFAEFFARIVLN